MSDLVRVLGKAASALAAAFGCSGPAADLTPENEPTRTHVVATVERQAHSGGSKEDLVVLLSAIRMPQSVNGDRVLRLMGLRSDLPPLGHCELIDLSNRVSPALSSVERIEFLDVGEVSVASGKRNLKLARQAFPTVADFISGVVYTSRDRNAELLPLESGLVIRARGAGKFKAFSLDVADLPPLERVTLDAAPLASVSRMALGTGFDLRWQPGKAGDELWVELAAVVGRKVVHCSFDDSLGTARVPGGLTEESGEARLTLHRLHTTHTAVTGFDQTEIRFDSRVTHPLVLY